MLKKFQEIQQRIFDEKLSVKTGWGRNEVKVKLLEATNEALAELLTEGTEKKDVIPGGFGSSGSVGM